MIPKSSVVICDLLYEDHHTGRYIEKQSTVGRVDSVDFSGKRTDEPGISISLTAGIGYENRHIWTAEVNYKNIYSICKTAISLPNQAESD